MSRLLLVLTLLASLLAGSLPLAASAAAPGCSWRAEYAGTLAALHEDTTLWTVGPAGTDDAGQRLAGTGGEGGAVVDPAVPCAYVGDVVRHEHMHLQQVRVFGTWHFAGVVLGEDRLEITADCGSLLLGSRYHPYVDQAGGCTARDLADARALVTWRH